MCAVQRRGRAQFERVNICVMSFEQERSISMRKHAANAFLIGLVSVCTNAARFIEFSPRITSLYLRLTSQREAANTFNALRARSVRLYNVHCETHTYREKREKATRYRFWMRVRNDVSVARANGLNGFLSTQLSSERAIFPPRTQCSSAQPLTLCVISVKVTNGSPRRE